VTAAPTAAAVIAALGLQPHPEGGHYRETFRDARTDANGRAASTAIYFLLAHGERSHWHRIHAVEIWHYHAGAPLTLSIADGAGQRTLTLGLTLQPASIRRASCRRTPGRRLPPPATGRWSDAPSPRDSILRRSNWRRTAGRRLRPGVRRA
jgi:hypothetical protein